METADEVWWNPKLCFPTQANQGGKALGATDPTPTQANQGGKALGMTNPTPTQANQGGKASGTTNPTPTQASQGGKATGKTNPTPTQANQGALVQSVESPLESWVFSTASCYHVTAQREIMENYTSGNFGKVYLATGNSMDVVGKGDVRIKISSNVTWILRDVKHIPGYAWNQLSVGVLAGEDYEMSLCRGVWKVSKGDFAFSVPPDPNPPMRITVLSASPF